MACMAAFCMALALACLSRFGPCAKRCGAMEGESGVEKWNGGGLF